MFAADGYAATGREAIVAAAGVTRGALQHHFGDKQSLFQAVYEQTEMEVMAGVAEAAVAAAGHDRPIEMLRAGCHAYLDAVLDPMVQRICAIDGPAVLASDVREAIADRYAFGLVRESVQAAVDKGEIPSAPVDPLTRMLLAGVMAAAQYVATSSEPKQARSEAGVSVDLMLDGLVGGRRLAGNNRPSRRSR